MVQLNRIFKYKKAYFFCASAAEYFIKILQKHVALHSEGAYKSSAGQFEKLKKKKTNPTCASYTALFIYIIIFFSSFFFVMPEHERNISIRYTRSDLHISGAAGSICLHLIVKRARESSQQEQAQGNKRTRRCTGDLCKNKNNDNKKRYQRINN